MPKRLMLPGGFTPTRHGVSRRLRFMKRFVNSRSTEHILSTMRYAIKTAACSPPARVRKSVSTMPFSVAPLRWGITPTSGTSCWKTQDLTVQKRVLCIRPTHSSAIICAWNCFRCMAKPAVFCVR